VTVPTVAPVATEGDPAAKLFLQKCAGCHTVGKGKLTGPDLNEAATWQAPDLDKGIKAMEVKVGPLANEDIVVLRDFLKSTDVRDRLAAEQERFAKATAASFDPPSPAIGEALFTGRTQLSGGGMACVACHAVSGSGGNLALPLDGVHAKLGETPLQSAIEKTSFKVMTAAYRNHPVTKQEAIHLTAYLGSLQPATTTTSTRVPLAGAIGAAVLFVALGLVYGGRRMSVRQQLLRRRRDGLD
jgi:mono/diheme cytochrome c family protein